MTTTADKIYQNDLDLQNKIMSSTST